VLTVEGRQLSGVGGDVAGGDAASVASAHDGHPVLAVGVPVLHLPVPGMQEAFSRCPVLQPPGQSPSCHPPASPGILRLLHAVGE
jgi:hypothetical protein